MTPTGTRNLILLSAASALALVTQAAQASDIPMPPGSRSWILVSSSDCDDDGPNANVDRGHCVGAVSTLNQPGDLGHGQIPNAFEIYAGAMTGPEAFHGSIQTTNSQFAFLDMSMIDTYTLNSTTLPAGTVVSISVAFRAVGTMYPEFTCCGSYGSGAFEIRIGSVFNPDPIVIPENTRVGGNLGAGSSAQLPFVYPRSSGADVPLDLTATATLDVAVGVPFDLAFYLGARPVKSRIDFSNTATISFTVPEGTNITSTGGYGEIVSVQGVTWSRMKARFSN